MGEIEEYIKARNIETGKTGKIPKPKILIANERIKEYVKDASILQVEVSAGELEKMLSEVKIPSEGIAVLIPSPCGEMFYIKGIKSIEIAKPIYGDFHTN